MHYIINNTVLIPYCASNAYTTESVVIHFLIAVHFDQTTQAIIQLHGHLQELNC